MAVTANSASTQRRTARQRPACGRQGRCKARCLRWLQCCAWLLGAVPLAGCGAASVSRLAEPVPPSPHWARATPEWAGIDTQVLDSADLRGVTSLLVARARAPCRRALLRRPAGGRPRPRLLGHEERRLGTRRDRGVRAAARRRGRAARERPPGHAPARSHPRESALDDSRLRPSLELRPDRCGVTREPASCQSARDDVPLRQRVDRSARGCARTRDGHDGFPVRTKEAVRAARHP